MYHKQAEIFNDIKSVFEHVIHGIETDNTSEIKDWSDHIIHNASIFQDKYSLRTGILVYALSKIHERHKFQRKEEKAWEKFWVEVITNIKSIINSIATDDIEGINKGYRIITRNITSVDKAFSEYIQHVFDKAKVQKAWKIYEHGLSLGRVAELMGISKWDAMKYLGQTKSSEYKEFVIEHIDKRFADTKKIFKRKGGG